MAPKLNPTLALGRAEETARSLDETARQAQAIEEAATRLASAGAQQAAAIEQVRGNFEVLAGGVDSAATAVQQLARGQALVSQSTGDTQKGLQAAATTAPSESCV